MFKLLCRLGFHKVKWEQLWHYEPTTYCERCDKQDVVTFLQRYEIWSAIHTFHPLAWPWDLYMMVRIKWDGWRNPHEDN